MPALRQVGAALDLLLDDPSLACSIAAELLFEVVTPAIERAA